MGAEGGQLKQSEVASASTNSKVSVIDHYAYVVTSSEGLLVAHRRLDIIVF